MRANKLLEYGLRVSFGSTFYVTSKALIEKFGSECAANLPYDAGSSGTTLRNSFVSRFHIIYFPDIKEGIPEVSLPFIRCRSQLEHSSGFVYFEIL